MTHPIDKHVGTAIRKVRWQNGLTQQQLAEAVGIKFQQIQKYETGANRVSASRLWEIAAALGVPVSHFFEGAGRQCEATEPDRDTIAVAAAYQALPDHQKDSIRNVIRAMRGVAV